MELAQIRAQLPALVLDIGIDTGRYSDVESKYSVTRVVNQRCLIEPSGFVGQDRLTGRETLGQTKRMTRFVKFFLCYVTLHMCSSAVLSTENLGMAVEAPLVASGGLASQCIKFN